MAEWEDPCITPGTEALSGIDHYRDLRRRSCYPAKLAALKALYADSKKGDKLMISKHRKAGNAVANGWLDRVLYCANPNDASKECDNDAGRYKVTIVADYNIPLKTAPHFALAGSDHLPIMVKYEVKVNEGKVH